MDAGYIQLVKKHKLLRHGLLIYSEKNQMGDLQISHFIGFATEVVSPLSEMIPQLFFE